MRLLFAGCAAVFAAGSYDPVSPVFFGPSNCVSVQRSEGGTCVLSTDCPSVQLINNFEFAFLCTTPDHRVQKHSFGVGGFDVQETFDTQVACTSCRAPGVASFMRRNAPAGAVSAVRTGRREVQPDAAATTAAPAPAPAPAADQVDPPAATTTVTTTTVATTTAPEVDEAPASTTTVRPVNAEKGKPAEASVYGPKHCVTTYRSPAGTCIMETRCNGVDITNYDFGLTCVDSRGESTRHLFGKNSFDQFETFDTLISCDMCLGLDTDTAVEADAKNATPAVASGNTAALEAKVEKLESEVVTLEARVEKLEATSTTAAPAPQALLVHRRKVVAQQPAVAAAADPEPEQEPEQPEQSAVDDGDDWGY
mmetsp:Transcript_15014/g.33012  ORF Transcript_15014/g.33012 Transcript_15014/m.33012 type:complete len:366 (+) Transcript_15014:117-1214(+)|eukprot:CAMPEP_0204272296 /NCGR_PEP_ID=MMETSP0468-20130131/22006_1 /ASSEMBLY_ACC=CAM_ASM_000383 /TAXON_ID=2969 /ORGANISM="Oxyrrhis marina" /LENGTH=365 /DNA_ID=CAMNT_0051248123 /DNA_START=89 /DNA_END=1186 /DNA_ORIENTATION=-